MTMLVSTGDKSPGSWNRPEGARGAIFRSTDCGDSWHRVGAGALIRGANHEWFSEDRPEIMIRLLAWFDAHAKS